MTTIHVVCERDAPWVEELQEKKRALEASLNDVKEANAGLCDENETLEARAEKAEAERDQAVSTVCLCGSQRSTLCPLLPWEWHRAKLREAPR